MMKYEGKKNIMRRDTVLGNENIFFPPMNNN